MCYIASHVIITLARLNRRCIADVYMFVFNKDIKPKTHMDTIPIIHSG